MKLIQVTNLAYQDFKSDKVYNAELKKIPKTNLWNIEFSYGRRGTSLVSGIKNEQPVPYNKAMLIYNKLIDSKLKKGYAHYAGFHTPASRKKETYLKFAVVLLTERKITQDEYDSIAKMLYSSDPETVNLAEVLIETKEQQKWEQN